MNVFIIAVLALVPQVQSYRITDRTLPAEGYRIRIGADGKADVSAADDAGRFYARKTLKQLPKDAKDLEIEDWPAFRWRGIHLDESRHFFGAAAVKKLIATMADHKLNVLHWHLVDDSGWRIDVPGYPEVAKTGATRGSRKGRHWLRDLEDGTYGPYFYTTEELKGVIAFAKENFVTIVPEIEIPGHASQLLSKCYPQFACDPKKPGGVFCLGNDEGLGFLDAAVDYVADLFPGEFVHIGGDEVNRKVWSTCAKCKARAKELGLKDTDALQNWVTRRYAGRLAKKGKRIIGWDEILDGGELPEDAAVMSWRGTEGGLKAVAAGREAVMCPHWNCYFDYTQCVKDDPVPYPCFVPPVPVSKVYEFDPLAGIPAEKRRFVIGGQCCNWTEWTCTPAELEWKIWPRACAIAEVFWTAPAKRDYDEFAARLAAHRPRLLAVDVNAAPIAPRDGVYLEPRPRKVKLTLGTLDVHTNVVTEALCKFTEDKSIAPGGYAMEIHFERKVTIRHSDAAGKARAMSALKDLARPDGRKLKDLSFSCMEIED